ncbi:hypothetical protein ASZ90_006866 [hydrocarbon metagenome]|uniref:Uncharacterized protein n=1 Tax=hydrocarbon metagenome TaxID=938273 RepID=A0A0W8FQZ0_9ZZZZ
MITKTMKLKNTNCQLIIKKEEGFTILEIMVALVLIAVVVSSFIQLSSANLNNLSSSDDQIDALIHANAKMREILDLEIIEDKSWNETDNDGYSYEITMAESLADRTDSLNVKMEEITLLTKWVKNNKKKEVVLKTAKVISKADALKNANN